MRRRLHLLVLSLCIAAAASGQAPAPAPELQKHAPADQRLAFEVIAHTHSGAPIELRDAAAFRVRIDGKQVPASDLTIAHQPPQIMFVLDAINTPRADLVRCQQALLTWLHNAGEHLPYDTTILIAADTQPTFKGLAPDAVSTWALIPNELYVARLSPTRNPAELASKLNAYQPGLARIGEASNAVTGNERVHISLQALSFIAAAIKDSPAPKLILWLSPGWPFVHMTESGFSDQLFDSIVYFDEALIAAHIVLYSLDPTGAATDHLGPVGAQMIPILPTSSRSGAPPMPTPTPGSDYYRNFLEPVRSARNAEPNDMVLPVLALHSGGTVQTSSNDILGGITRFIADADAVFSVSLPAPKVTGKTSFHSVEIKSATPDESLRTRIGFYAH